MAGPDGVVVIPLEAAEDVLRRARQKVANEEQYVQAVRRGEFSNAWVDALLDADGCVFS
jgi:regulator of RNase E activity RraA